MVLSPNKSASTANGMYNSCIFWVVLREAAIYFLICEATVVSANPFNGDVAFVWYSEYMDIEWYWLPAYRPTLHYTKLHYITVQHSIVHGTTSSTFYCISSGCITLSTLHCMHTWVNSHIDWNSLLFCTAGKRQTAAVGCTPCQPGDPMLERKLQFQSYSIPMRLASTKKTHLHGNKDQVLYRISHKPCYLHVGVRMWILIMFDFQK